MKILIIICIAIIVILFLGLVYFTGYLLGGFNADNECEDEIAGLKKEITWWKKQCNKVLCEKNKIQTELLENKGRYCRKKHILQSEVMEDNRGYVINMRAEGKTREQIAKELNVSPATVGRALKKWGYYKDIRGRRVGK